MFTADEIETEALALYSDYRTAAGRAPTWEDLTREEQSIWLTVAQGVLDRHRATVGGPSDPDPPK